MSFTGYIVGKQCALNGIVSLPLNGTSDSRERKLKQTVIQVHLQSSFQMKILLCVGELLLAWPSACRFVLAYQIIMTPVI